MVDTLTQANVRIQTPTPGFPQHVGIIMDGNGRWARARGLPRHVGHRAGVENLRRIIRAVVRYGIHYLTIYAFSTENWSRPKDEVKRLISLIDPYLERELPELHQKGVRLRHLGRLDGLPAFTQQKIRQAIHLTRDNQTLALNIAFNYGGRAEITDAIRNILREGVSPNDVSETLIDHHLYTSGQPDPELIVRTAGECRLSNFLLWQSAHATIYTTEVYWPDFDEHELLGALNDYAARRTA